MKKERLEVYSDGVMAIITTIMVLELKVPHGEEWSDLSPLWPVFLSYFLSFNNISMAWYMHHNTFHDIGRINTRILLANLNLLFWLSLIPFATSWMGESGFAPVPLA